MVDRKSLKIKINIVSKYKELINLQARLGISRDDIRTLLSVMFELTSAGFEQYIAEYLRKIQKFENINVIGGYGDKGIDINGIKNGHFYAIQCKKFGASHITQKEVLDFIQNTQELKKERGYNLSLYLITSSRVNKYAKQIAKKAGIIIKNYRDILKIDQQFPLTDFIKKYKGDNAILEGIDTEDVLNTYYLRKQLKRRWFADVLYFIFQHTLFKFFDLGVDYEKIEENNKKDQKQDYEFLQNKSPISPKSTFIGKL